MIPIGPELIVLLAVVVLLFGSRKIPELARATGEAVSEFRNAAPDE
jgi:sec-independent protein translocase protein TatA